jgi:hypothetical protein
VINAGAGDDTIKGLFADIVTDADIITFGDGTDTLHATDQGNLDFSAYTASIDDPETYLFSADASAETYRFAHGNLTAAATITLTSATDGHEDIFYLEKLTTNFATAAENATTAVTAAGEWMLVNSTSDGVLHYYNESLGSAATATITGLDAGAADPSDSL